MPFFETDETAPGGLAPISAEVQTSRPTDFFAETLPAAFRSVNAAASFATWAGNRFAPDAPQDMAADDPFEDIQGYEQYAGSFAGLDTVADVQRMKAKIDRENADREVLASAGPSGVVASLAAGIIDPVNLIPVGGILVKSGEGYSILKGLKAGVAAGAVAAGASEAVLSGTQETRTTEESLFNVAASALLVGVIGGAVPVLANTVKGMRTGDALADVARAVEKDLEVPPVGRDISEPGSIHMSEEDLLSDTDPDMVFGGSAGAKAVRDTTLAEETLKSALGAEKAFAFQDPLMRTASSPAIGVRRVVQEMAESPLVYDKNALGVASPIAAETKGKMWNANLSRAVEGVDNAFVKYRTGKSPSVGSVMKLAVGDAFRRGGKKLTYGEFREEVGRALRRGDVSDIPEATEAAKTMRKEVFDPLKDRAIEAGLLPEGVSQDTALSYLTRVYDVPKIVAKRGEFEGRITEWLKTHRDDAGSRMEEARAKVESLTPKADALEKQLDELRGTMSEDGTGRVGRLTGEKQAWKEGRSQTVAKERDLVAAKRALKNAESQFKKAQDRLDKYSPTEIEKGDPLSDTLRDLRRGIPEPKSMTAWLRSNGGLREIGGEVKAIDAKGLLNNKSGMHAEDAATRAWEAGFFPTDEAPPDINTFLWALRDDANGVSKLYRQDDWEVVAYREYLADFGAELDKRGIDINGVSDAKIKAQIEADATGLPPNFVASNPSTRARAREISFNARRAERMTSAERERLAKAEASLAEVKAKRDAARTAYHATLATAQQTEKELSRTKAALARAQNAHESDRVLSGLDDIELDDVSRQITDNITGSANGRINYEAVPLARGPMKERTLAISDYAIEDFLESDAEVVARIYTRTMGIDSELAMSFGSPDMARQLDQVREEFAALRKKVPAGDEKTMKAIDDRMKADIRDIEGMRDRLRGTYAMPRDPNSIMVRGARVMRNLNYVRLLGGMTASAIPDLGRSVMIHGMMRTVRDGVVPLVKNLRTFRLAAEESKLAGTALDMVLDSRAMQLAEVWDDYGRLSKFERGVHAMTSRYGVVSLMAPWNAAIKQFVGVVTQTRILQAAEAGAAIGGKDVERLAFLGISPEMTGRIAKQFSAHGEKTNGVYLASTGKWTDGEAVEAFRAAMVKEIDRAIVTPGQDKPLMMSTELGKTIGQFKTFAFASTQRTALAALQQRDAAALNGALLSVGLGMISYGVKSYAAGYETSEDPKRWISEGLDKSGLFFWMSDAMNTGGKLVGFNGASRYASRSVSETILGPTLGGALNLAATVGSAAGHGEWKASDTRALRRLLPYQNLIYFRRLFDQAEEGINHAIGAE